MEAPQLISVRRLSSFQLGLEFSAAMAEPAPYSFRVEPDLGPVVAAVADRGGRRIVLSYAAALPDSGRFAMGIGGLRTRAGGPLADPAFAFALSPQHIPARPLRAEVLSAQSVAIHFDGPVVAEGVLLDAFVFVDTSLQVLAARVLADRVVLELAAPLRPLGRSYGIRITGLRDENGQRVEGAVSFRYAAADLAAAAPFPNPYRPGSGALTFGFLTAEAEVAIFDASGNLVRTLIERDGDGGVQWDGRNQAGQMVGTGVYLYRIAHGAEARVGKLAVLRD
jgi:hypothetical protein